jgi:predicted metal-dependent hydrolase
MKIKVMTNISVEKEEVIPVMDYSIIEIDGVGLVLFERSKRARRMNIFVKPSTGVRVAVPHGVSFRKAEEFARDKARWIKKHQNLMKLYEKENRPIHDIPAGIERMKARRKIVERLEHLAEKHGFKYNRIFVRNQKTRWGSCSCKGNISLNIKLVKLPGELMDYVILHELVHTRVMNHSSDFWDELDKLVVDRKGLRSRLRGYGLALL